jgi:hypothetical protein
VSGSLRNKDSSNLPFLVPIKIFQRIYGYAEKFALLKKKNSIILGRLLIA